MNDRRILKHKQMRKFRNISWQKISFFLTGLGALIWFLIRVIPKPSRATYPCQKAAFPVASAFIIWIVSAFTSFKLFKKTGKLISQSRYKLAIPVAVFAIVAFVVSFVNTHQPNLLANTFYTAEVSMQKPETAVLNQLPSTVSMVQSSKNNASEISYNDLENMIREAVNLAGGLDDIIEDGDKVVLKPNMLIGKEKSRFNGVTTDKDVVDIVAKIVRELNPNGKILVMEGTAAASTTDYMEDMGWTDSDYVDEFIAFETNSGGWYEYDSPKLHAVSLPDEISLYPDEKKPNKSRELYFNKEYFEADVIISLPVMKNHYQAGITGGVKNVAQGCTPANIYGEESRDGTWRYLRNKYLDHDPQWIHKWLHDFYAARPIDFVIMEGIQGVEEGPAGGMSGNNLKRLQKNMRVILAGKDAVAVDAIQSLAMMHDPEMVYYLVHLHNHGYGVVNPALINLKGKDLPAVRKSFKGKDHSLHSKYSQTVCPDYDLSQYAINSDILNLSVDNISDLARVELKIDDQPLNKYIVNNFKSISVSLDNINVSNGDLQVTFYDKYLNHTTKKYSISTSNNQYNNSTSLKVYPTIAQTVITIDAGNMNDEYKLQIIDLSGSVHYSSNHINDKKVTIPVTALKNGNYIVRVITKNNEMFTQKILKQ